MVCGIFYGILISYFLFTATVFASLVLKPPTKQDFAEKRKAQDFFSHFLNSESSSAQTSV